MKSWFNCKTCYAFDALGAFVFNNYCRNDIPKIKDDINKWFADIDINASNSYFDLLVKAVELSEIEEMGTKKLNSVFCELLKQSNYDEDVKDQITKSFYILEQHDFYSYWKRECYPILVKQCNEYMKAYDDVLLSKILMDIKRVQKAKDISGISVYITYFMFPVSFTLTETSYLTNYAIGKKINPNSIMKMFIHELCHRFADAKTIDEYKNLCCSDAFLNKTNFFLLEVKGSGNEEEFVTALEHFIAIKNNLETEEVAFSKLLHHYESCQPIAIILLKELLKLKDIPSDVDLWIREVIINLSNNIVDIKELADSVLSGFSTCFNNSWEKYKEENNSKVIDYEKTIGIK